MSFKYQAILEGTDLGLRAAIVAKLLSAVTFKVHNHMHTAAIQETRTIYTKLLVITLAI